MSKNITRNHQQPDNDFCLKSRLEALLFASPEPLSEEELTPYFPEQTPLANLLSELQQDYQGRGINLCCYGDKWTLRTAPQAAEFLSPLKQEERRLSRAAIETLAIIAYHQPITRAEIEIIRGVQVSRGTLDILMECQWICPGKRHDGLGRALTWVTTDHFLQHFSLSALSDLPDTEELRAAGFMPELLHRVAMEQSSDERENENDDIG